ncbi:signal peptide peptidase SppA [Tenacibaculum sp. SG-28]|uniref:signal peptide peptidase SppA n=1 Tax=Tenacibaculum sp. SG-28 TaxID=754426 RepID=UPI000CF51F3B|nr:signal peptide peptidase SppA [Tenacibaculum sp. SG-28]PQJ22847.1 signal peptide peptidase SppA [Tenacibaculum sp. SG-28]
MKFLRNLLASILGFFISLFLFFMFFALVGSLMSSSEDIEVKSNSIIELDLSASVKDFAPKDDNPLSEILDYTDEKVGLNAIINAIENAQVDPNILGISIKTSQVNAGVAQTQAIRDKLSDFKESGKFIFAYNDFYDQKNYYLSSVADSLFVNPVGSIDFKGLSTEILYYKDFEDKYGVKMEVIRHGKYKSAVEPYLTNTMSESNREQTTSFLQSIWSEMLSDISVNRNISEDKLNNIADNLQGRNATSSKNNSLVDGIIYQDEYVQKLKNASSEKIHMISLQDYIASGKGRRNVSVSKDKIAVIYAQGEIMYGEGNEDVIGQGIINKAIKKAKKDASVKAVVLRVNSPGGSALASELIWRELELLKKEKPLVVSMGNVAASGGYYISCNADKVFAEPTTITGSIGVFGMLPNMEKLASRIGINAEQVSTNNNPEYSLFEPMDPRFYEVTKEGVEDIYDTFLTRVSNGRKLTKEAVDAVAQGRVWTGKEAVNIGLVDALGNLDDAIIAAANLADVSAYRIRNYPNYTHDFKDSFSFNPFLKASKEKLLKETLGAETYRLYTTINEFQKWKGIQVRMPYLFEIK